jgi:energy-coupling factor transporter ATP-binding protein EcfA2
MFTQASTSSFTCENDLKGLSKDNILSLFKALRSDGKIGFDHERMKKQECIEKLMAEHTVTEITEAMSRANFMPTDVTPKAATPSLKKPAADKAALAEQIANLLAGTATETLDEERVKAIVDDAIADAVKRLVNRIEVKQPDLPAVEVGIQHKHFETLLKACNARQPDGHRLNVWLVGPAGSGKTTAAKMVAKALGMTFTFNGAISTEFQLTGFKSASGEYQRTPFRDAWEYGGVYLFDEVDSSNPAAVMPFNAALANGCYAFPDKLVDRHPNCIVIAGANTSGNGATHEYVGRMKQDKAFLDRFVEIDWPVDEKLEAAIVPNEAWVLRVQGVRKRVSARGIKGHMITPRASTYGAALLAAGLPMETVEKMVLKKGLADDAWNQIK